MSAFSGAKWMPASLDQFLADLGRLHGGRFSDVVNRVCSGTGPADVVRLAHELVRIQALTSYQAAALYQGKGRGLVVGPYVLLDKIGRGGMGIVFKAVHRQLGAVVALKVLPPSLVWRNRAVVKRFRREAKALARIQHPNIVSCFEHVKEADGVYYLVMEYVEGRDLKSLVESTGVLPVRQAVECLLQAAKGLQCAHSLGIIHRDIKPANLMLDRRNTVRILDFGLSRVAQPEPWLLEGSHEAATRAIHGTIPYMSPEQARDSTKADARSDIYSLGCTLHFLLTARPPYRGRTWSEMFLAHRQAPIPSLRATRPKVPDYLDDLFRRMLAKNPADRPRTMGAVIASIELSIAELGDRPSSSQTIPVRCPDEPEVEPAVNLDDLEIEGPAASRHEEVYYTGRRLRPPGKSWSFTTLARYLLLAGALIVALILLIEWVLSGARGAEPATTATGDADHGLLSAPCPPGLLAASYVAAPLTSTAIKGAR
jgi:serine/threonine protein kinase